MSIKIIGIILGGVVHELSVSRTHRLIDGRRAQATTYVIATGFTDSMVDESYHLYHLLHWHRFHDFTHIQEVDHFYTTWRMLWKLRMS